MGQQPGASASQQPGPPPPRSPQPKPRAGRRLAVGLLVVVLVLAGVGVVAGFLLSAPSATPTPVEFEVLPGWGGRQVAQELQEEGLIRSSTAFTTYLRVRDLDHSIGEGLYDLNPAMSAPEVAATLVAGGRPRVVSIVVPEGWRAADIVSRLAANGVSTAAELAAVVADPGPELAPPYLPAGRSLEGYLFPAVYDVPLHATAEEALGMMVRRFREELADFDIDQAGEDAPAADEATADLTDLDTTGGDPTEADEESAAPSESGADPSDAATTTTASTEPGTTTATPTDLAAELARRGLTVHSWVTLASMVQAEAASVEEMGIIAGVFANRLELGMPLQSDPTVAYGLGKALPELSAVAGDLRIDTPWNTYTRDGVPAGPIGNPGSEALRAVLEPERYAEDGALYLYFLHGTDDGEPVFRPNTNLPAHNRDVETFLRSQ